MKTSFLLATILMLTPMIASADAVIFGGTTTVKALKPILDLNGGAQVQSASSDPTSSAVSAPRGSLLLGTGNGKLYIKQDAGSSTNWNTAVAASTDVTTKGDLLVRTSSALVRKGVGADDTALVASAADTSGVAYHIKTTADTLENASCTASVAANALTIALKTAAGNDASASDPIKIGFRSATLTAGDVSLVKVTGALSLVISSGSTLGHVSAADSEIYVGVINNAGTAELFATTQPLNEEILISTTAEGGAGAADAATAYYSTTARTTKAFRWVCKLISTQTTAGTWAAVPTSIVSGGQAKIIRGGVLHGDTYVYAGNGYGSTNTKIRRYTNTLNTSSDVVYADSATLGASFTITKVGTYSIHRCDSKAGANLDVGVSLNSNQLTTNVSTITAANRIAIWEMPTTGSANSAGCVGTTRFLIPGDVIRPHDNIAADDTTVYSWFVITRVN